MAESKVPVPYLSYVTVKIGTVTTALSVLLFLKLNVTDIITFPVIFAVSWVWWYSVWDLDLPNKPSLSLTPSDKPVCEKFFKKPFGLFTLHVVTTAITPFIVGTLAPIYLS